MADFRWLCLVVTVAATLRLTTSLNVKVDGSKVRNIINERFLSVAIDMSVLAPPKWRTFEFNSTKVRTLLRGLAPGYLRFGGTSADYSVFSDAPPEYFTETGVKPSMLAMSSHDWDNVVNLTRDTGFHFLFDVNLLSRYADQWDPTNFFALLEYLNSKGYTDNVDFELGNEPDLFPSAYKISGAKISNAFLVMLRALRKYPAFNASVVVGPDVAHWENACYKDVVDGVGKNLSAATFHHYYFKGPTAKVSQYTDPKYFPKLETEVKKAIGVVADSSTPDLPVWLGETGPAYDSGTPNVSDRYVAAFLWLDKLGVSASLGLKLVVRQSFYHGNYALIGDDLNPNPDYWLSYVFNTLVGKQVLSVTLLPDMSPRKYRRKNTVNVDMNEGDDSNSDDSVRVYAHCTKSSNKYWELGAVTMYALNVKQNDTELLTFDPILGQGNMDVYLMTPDGDEGLLSSYVQLNGKRLTLVDNSTLPQLNPKQQSVAQGFKLPPLTYAFIVFPQADFSICKN